MEVWKTINGFPNYKISDAGHIINSDTGRYIKVSLTKRGLAKVGLVNGGVQYTRSLALLVAENYVEGKDDIFDTPVHLDGDRLNNIASNLVWRPRWFAWKYARQFEVPSVHNSRGPIFDDDSGLVYQTFFDAATTHGLLVEDIWKCLIHKKSVFPTNQIFKFIK